MARHDQKPRKSAFVCARCQDGECHRCIDVFRVVLKRGDICKCTRPEHSGEPVNKQVRDPETGTVYGPDMTVTTDGDVQWIPDGK